MSEHAQCMEMSGGDIFVNGKLAWRNPDRSGVFRGIKTKQIGNKLYVNGELVFTDDSLENRQHNSLMKNILLLGVVIFFLNMYKDFIMILLFCILKMIYR